MKAEKFKKYINKTNELADDLIQGMYIHGVLDDDVNRKEFETAIEIMSDAAPQFNKDLYKLGMRALFLKFEGNRQECEGCENKRECKKGGSK